MASTLRGADLLVQALETAGVEHLFALSGNQIMPVFDACIDSEIAITHVRHEAAAVHMADAWGRLTGQPGVALVTAGPGFANTLSALYVALMAESPVVLLSGHAPTGVQGRGGFQEMAQAEMAGFVSKASWTAVDAGNLGHDLARAFRLARSGRPGPVHIAIPFDCLQTEVENRAQLSPQIDDFQAALGLLDTTAAREVLAALQQAQRPLVLAGPSAMRVGDDVLSSLAAALNVPVVGMESPRGRNDPALGAFAEMLPQADVIMLLGKKLDFTLGFGSEPGFHPDCRWICIDSEMAVLEKAAHNLPAAARLVSTELADALPTIERLQQLAEEFQRPNDDWRREVEAAIRFRPDDWSSIHTGPDEPLHAAAVCRVIQDVLGQHEPNVLISDGGEFGQWAQACIHAGQRCINGPSGAIGSAIPFAAAARLADPEARIVALLGDGTFGFHPLEFETAVRANLPFVAVVGNDACWNAEHQIQLRDYGADRLIGCELSATRCDEVVRALGGHGEHVSRLEELKPALERAFAVNLPACVNVEIGRHAAPIVRR